MSKINLHQIDPIENWVNAVAFSHSNSESTKKHYKIYIKKFLTYAGITANQIVDEYNRIDEKKFKQRYTPIVSGFIGFLQNEKYSPATQALSMDVVKSFFKYNSLPLNYIPNGKKYVVYHNRDLEKVELEIILKNSQPRERAYFALIAQSGLRPNEVSNLKIENIERFLQDDSEPPYMIQIPQDQTKGKYHGYFTFAGSESIGYIKEYLKRKRQQPVKPEDYIFTQEDGKSITNVSTMSHIFRNTVEKLKAENVLDFKNKKGDKTNRNELRLYNLRKYFRNHAGSAGEDFVNFWMGHSLGVDGHYFSQTDHEKHRKQYTTLAMPNLRLESKTPDQTDESLIKLSEENKELRNQISIQQAQISEIKNLLDYLMKMQKFAVEPITEDKALEALTNTPEERQVDLTPDRRMLKLKKALSKDTKDYE